MLKVLVVSTILNKVIMKRVEHIPAIGSKIDDFFTPLPTVTDIINYPKPETVEKLGFLENIDAIICVD